MRASELSFVLFRFLIPPAIIATLFLYLYAPIFDCSFPAQSAEAGCAIPGQQKNGSSGEVAPFRLLALGDPQLEGDTSLPDLNTPLLPSLNRFGKTVGNGDALAISVGLGTVAKDLILRDIPKLLYGYRKKLDLWGNDLYLAHIYRSVSWWADPTHTVVLGDLLGSQWISDGEFQRRSNRFWNRVFKGAQRVPRAITDTTGRVEILGQDRDWKRRIIAVAGNHDIGYAGDINEDRIERFENAYGNVNWEIRFKLENATSLSASSPEYTLDLFATSQPELRLIILNSMNLDSPALNLHLQQQSREFGEAKLHAAPDHDSKKSATVLLTHIPFHKEAGTCVDAPLFSFFPPDQGGGIREQNHLSEATTSYLLNGLVGRDGQRKVIVLNGHDHEGCDTYHHCRRPDFLWKVGQSQAASSEVTDESHIGVREITVRSMMGSFHGNAGFLSGWYDWETQEWKFEYNSCMLGVQHIWWAVHVLDIIVAGLGLVGLTSMVVDETSAKAEESSKLQSSKIKKA